MQERIFWQDLQTVGEPSWCSLFLKGYIPCKKTYAGAVLEEMKPMGRTHVGEDREGLSAVGDTPC